MTYKGFYLVKQADGWRIQDTKYIYGVKLKLSDAKKYVNLILWSRANIPL